MITNKKKRCYHILLDVPVYLQHHYHQRQHPYLLLLERILIIQPIIPIHLMMLPLSTILITPIEMVALALVGTVATLVHHPQHLVPSFLDPNKVACIIDVIYHRYIPIIAIAIVIVTYCRQPHLELWVLVVVRREATKTTATIMVPPWMWIYPNRHSVYYQQQHRVNNDGYHHQKQQQPQIYYQNSIILLICHQNHYRVLWLI